MSTCFTDPETGIESCNEDFDQEFLDFSDPTSDQESSQEPSETLMAPPSPRQTTANDGMEPLESESTGNTWTEMGSGATSFAPQPTFASSTIADGGSVTSQAPTMILEPSATPTLPSTVIPGSSQNTNHEPINSPSPAVAPSSSSTPVVNQGVAPGAVAGIAIATTLLGAAIALIAAFFIFKRRQNAKIAYKDSRATTPELMASLKGGNHRSYVSISQSITKPPAVASSVPKAAKGDLDLASLTHSSDFLKDILPKAADENTVKNRCAGLFNQILRHVESYYRDVHANMTPSMESDLARFGSESLNMVMMLQESSMPTVAIKHALSGFIMSIVSPDGEEQATLFPAEIAGLKKSERLGATDGMSSPHLFSTILSERCTNLSNTDDQAAYIIYKRLAVHLHSPDAASLQARQADIREAAEHFALTFFPWINPTVQDQEKDQELIKIMNSALELSIWLYGQPYQYEFMWEDPGFRGTAITPGLTRTTDRRGKKVFPPHVLLEPIVVAS